MNKGDDNEPDSEQGLDWSVKEEGHAQMDGVCQYDRFDPSYSADEEITIFIRRPLPIPVSFKFLNLNLVHE